MTRKFKDNQARVKNRKELFTQLYSEIGKLKSEVILNTARKLNIPAAEIKNLRQVFQQESAQSLVVEETINGIPTKKIKHSAIKWTGQ